MKVEPTGYNDCKRVVNDRGEVLVMISRYTSGFWALHCKDTDRKISSAIFKTPSSALKHFKEQQK